jgi:DNA-binding MarR family transcriptional regulator
MEERGLVARTRVPEDRRVVLVEISPAGLSMLGDAESLRDDMMRRVLARIDPTHLADIACAMTDLRTAVEAEVTDPESTIHAHQHTRRD